MAPTDFSGKWELEKSENLDKYLEEIGVTAMGKDAAAAVGGRTTLTVNQDGDHFVIVASTAKGDTEEEFTVGKEFDTTIRNTGITGLCLPTWEENVLVCHVTFLDPDIKPHRVTRELTSATEQVITLYVGDVVCKRYYKKQKNI